MTNRQQINRPRSQCESQRGRNQYTLSSSLLLKIFAGFKVTNALVHSPFAYTKVAFHKSLDRFTVCYFVCVQAGAKNPIKVGVIVSLLVFAGGG